ncbi:coiled-coil domain-containing protein 141 isoform X2 [Cebidichthys violaceus]
MEKLKKHEGEVLAVVEKNQQTEQLRRRRRNEGLIEHKRTKKQEEEEEVHKAMVASLTEGWSLLLRLLQRRQEVLLLAKDFYGRAEEFSVCLDRVEDLQFRLDRLTEVQVSYDVLRRDLLGKSLQVLTSSSFLLQKLRQLQRTEDLQRRGRGLQEEEEEESSQCSGGAALRLEELVEVLQDRRRTADQAVKLQLQQAENGIMVHEKEHKDWKILDQDLQSRSTSAENADMESESRTLQTRDLQPGPRSDLKSGSKSEETRDLQPGPRSDQTQGSGSDARPGSRSERTTNGAPGSKSKETSNFESGSKLYLKPESGSELQPGSRSKENNIFKSGSRLELNLMVDSRSDPKSDSGSEDTRDLKAGSRLDPRPRSVSQLKPESKLVVKPGSRSEETRDQHSGSRSEETGVLQSGLKPDVQIGSRLKLDPASRSGLNLDCRSEETRDLQPGSRLDQMPELGSDTHPKFRLDVKPESGSEEIRDLKTGSKLDKRPGLGLQLKLESKVFVNPGFRTEETKVLQSGSSVQAAGQQSMLGKETPGGEGHAHQTLLTNRRLQLLSSCEHLVDKISRWLQQSSSLLSISSEAGWHLPEAEHTLNTHLQLRTQAESAGQDAENMMQILDQIRALHTSETRSQPPSETSRQLSPLKALTEQLKRGGAGSRTRTLLGPPAADLTGPPSPELSGRVDLVLKELQSLNRRIDSNLQLLQPFVSFLRTAQQVEEEMEELMEIYRKRPEEDEEEEAGSSRKKKKQLDACWQETLQKILTCQELGDDCVRTVSTVSGALNLQSLVSAVQRTVERLGRTKQEVNELQSQQQIQIQQQQQYCRKYQERLDKTLQDLNCVSEMLDSCTLIDLGSDLQTSRLVEHFSQARPHFTRLDAEVEFTVKSWETLSGVQDLLEVEESKGVKEEDLSELLKLQEKVKNKIHQSESILDLSSSFHLTAKKLEAMLQSDPGTGSVGSAGPCGSSEADQSGLRGKQIQSLLETASTLRTEICSSVTVSGWTCFRVEQLETRLVSLDSRCVSSLKEDTRREDELLTRLLNDDITQLRDSFKELKKKFSNLRFNYLKRNDRTRNTKASRNQLQQVDQYEEKLQVIRKRLQGVTARLGSEVKDGGVAKEAEDAVNELQRQTGELERSVKEHQKTLEMSCSLQRAVEEYQFWCEEASATIARVGKFSSECRSTEAVSVLYRQFEKFVWPTVPQQEERISQITELAVRLHGVEEGRRYTEKTVSKHADMVEAIRQLSDGLMELENKLKMENLKQEEEEEEEKEKKMKENRQKKKTKETDNRCSLEADMYELKETGHTPELTAEHDGKEVPVKRQNAANRKPPLQKSRCQEADRQTDSRQQSHTSSHRSTHSFSSTHSSFSLSCSPVEPNRRVHAVHGQSQPAAADLQATPPPSVIGPTFSDIQREFQKKEKRSNMTPLQDASAGHLSEAQLQQQEEMSDDSLSNDEYDCASPDDISLPPLAETPESITVQSDVEESFCFSSHSVHINQSEHSGTGTATGAARQQRESSRTESCPTPPNGRHSSTRAESSSFVQSPLTVPAPSLLTSILCSILKTGKTSTANAHRSIDPEPGVPCGSHPVHKSDPPDKDHDVPEKRSPSRTDPLLKEHNSRYYQPQMSPGIQGKIAHHVASKGETLLQTDLIPQVAELNHSTTLPHSSCGGPDPDLHKDTTPPQDTRFLKCSTTLPFTALCRDSSPPQSFPDSESDLDRDMKETSTVSKPQRDLLTNTTITQQTLFFQPSSSDFSHRSGLCSPQDGPSSQRETLPRIDPVPQALTDPVFHKVRIFGLLESCTPCLQTTTTLPEDGNVSRSYLDSRSGLDQDASSSQTSKETSSVRTPQSSSLTTACCRSSPLNSHCTLAQSSIHLGSQQEGGGGPPEVQAPVLPEPNGSQSHQTVCSFHESSSCTQQCVHGPGMTPSSPTEPAAPPPPEPQTQALAPQANPHVTPLSSPPHLLTPDQDPNICQPVAVREEIRLTPQIQGPPFPPPPSPPPPAAPAQAESLPQGKASKPGPPCFTRPLSRATVMEGSPVTLEVELTGDPEPRLTWCKDGEAGKHFLFTPEATDSDGGLNEAADRREDDGDEDDEWLLAQVFDIITVDWHTWFGTLCVLLWLIYLILLY